MVLRNLSPFTPYTIEVTWHGIGQTDSDRDQVCSISMATKESGKPLDFFSAVLFEVLFIVFHVNIL